MTDKYYEPKYLYGVLKEIQPINAYFRRNFFSETITFPTPSVTFEHMKSQRGLLPYANEHLAAPVIGRNGYEVRSYTPPLLSGARVISVDTLREKLAGESPYNSGESEETRAAKIAANDLEELQAAIQRREEFMCAKLKQDGKLELDGAGISGIVDYGFNNIETAGTSSLDKWTSGYDILGKLQEVSRTLLKSGTNPDILIMGVKAADALVNNTKIAKLLDNRRINLGDIAPEKLADGVQYLGRLVSVGLFLDLYCYNDFYVDESGQALPYIDDGTVIMQSSKENNFMLYGSVSYIGEDNNYVTAMNEYVPYVVTEKDPPMRKLIVSSRPLPMPRDINSWYVLKEVA